MPESNIFSMRDKKLGFLAKNSFSWAASASPGWIFLFPSLVSFTKMVNDRFPGMVNPCAFAVGLG
jgi:hypothetical protein